MIRISHPEFEHSACSAIDTEECLSYLQACGWIHTGKAMSVIFLGCGFAASETSLILIMLQQGYNIKRVIFMDHDVCSSTIKHIQALTRKTNLACFVATSYHCLCNKVLKEAKDRVLVLGIHAGFRFSTHDKADDFICFLEKCKQLADEDTVQPEFINLQHLDWTCRTPDATFHRTCDSSKLWVYHTLWSQQLELVQLCMSVKNAPEFIGFGESPPVT